MNDAVAPGFLDRLKISWGGLWRDLAGSRDFSPDAIRATLPKEDSARVYAQMRACLEGKGGEVSARQRAAALGRAYLNLNPEGRLRFLRMLAVDFDTDHDRVDAAMTAVARAGADIDARLKAEAELRKALEAPRRVLLTQFNALPEGIKFLVDMRAELLSLTRSNPELIGLEQDLKQLLARWFDVGFLEMSRITWRSPAIVLEKIIEYEAVHAIQSLNDLKNRLDSDRRLYAFFHPRMPDEPLIFVEVALVDGLAGSIQELLDLQAPVGDPGKADTAIFYSISNAQNGLAGISFGNFLIKTVVDNLRSEFDNLKQFATLSPIPGFRKWLDRALAEGDPDLLTPSERKDLRGATGLTGGTKGMLKAVLDDGAWAEDMKVREALKAPLMRLCARYLVQEKRSDGNRVLDPVAHFHLSNGARMERLNWLGDTSEKGMGQSAGLMINYLYKLADIDTNHEAYSGQGRIALSSGFKSLVK